MLTNILFLLQIVSFRYIFCILCNVKSAFFNFYKSAFFNFSNQIFILFCFHVRYCCSNRATTSNNLDVYQEPHEIFLVKHVILYQESLRILALITFNIFFLSDPAGEVSNPESPHSSEVPSSAAALLAQGAGKACFYPFYYYFCSISSLLFLFINLCDFEAILLSIFL